MDSFLHSINIAAKRSGLSAHVIRIWEKRYKGVVPMRSPSNRRLYSEQDIERLFVLKIATELGHRIANIAHLDITQLRELIAADHQASEAMKTPDVPPVVEQSSDWNPNVCVDNLFQCVKSLDMDQFDRFLSESALKLGHQGMLCHIVAPLMKLIGEAWQSGDLNIAQEHVASASLKTFIFASIKPFSLPVSAPRIVIATPTGQMHEIGSVIVTALAANLGWKTTFLGASVPSAEIAGAVRQNNSKALALSLVYPYNDPDVVQALKQLRGYLQLPFPILVGGQAQSSYTEVLEEIQAIQCLDLTDTRHQLTSLQQ
ncbi:MAG: cobalamin B12-binding domain-containing protein [Verrucomicrobiota bacterium]|nr:cobalamin B12-binding domain-containing protein [Verrucomicrobiota bacterium]MDG1890925.1 cobalamin B12-binding domain-containing protein [Verrucomicrobiota bacterium]